MAIALALSLAWATSAESKTKKERLAPEHRIAEVQILGLNETHGQLVPLSQRNADGSRTAVGGAAALATYLEGEEAENPSRTLTVDSGDFMQGPAISSYFEGRSTVEVYNEMGVDSVAVGNHEFDWGRDALRQRIAEADFRFLANNIVEDATGEQPEGIAPYEVFELKGVRVGVIGVGNPDTKNVTLPEATEGLSFLDLEGTAEAVTDSVKELEKRKVGAIAREVNHRLLHHLSYLRGAVIHVDPVQEAGEENHRIPAHSHDDLPLHSH